MSVLAHKHSDSSTDPSQARSFPPEIVEMIIAHLKYDTPTLKACAATCFSWYNVAVPHLHRTLILWEPTPKKYQNQLPSLLKLGLLPFVEKLQVRLAVVPAMFDSRNMQYFHAMVNLQELWFAGPDFSKFPAGFGEYLGHFSPTLRSVALSRPNGTRRQLLNLLRLFPKLEDITIDHYADRPEAYEPFDSQLVPIRGRLRGRLSLKMFGEEGLLRDIIVAFEGMRFTYMELHVAQGKHLLLEACADTLETLRIYPRDIYDPSKRVLKRF